MLATEATVLTTATAARGAGIAMVRAEDLAAGFAGRELSAEQRALVHRLLTSGDGVEVLVGKASDGETFAITAAAAAWRAKGVPVLGTAGRARAALAFGEQPALPAMTVTRLLTALDHPVNAEATGLGAGHRTSSSTRRACSVNLPRFDGHPRLGSETQGGRVPGGTSMEVHSGAGVPPRCGPSPVAMTATAEAALVRRCRPGGEPGHLAVGLAGARVVRRAASLMSSTSRVTAAELNSRSRRRTISFSSLSPRARTGA